MGLFPEVGQGAGDAVYGPAISISSLGAFHFKDPWPRKLQHCKLLVVSGGADQCWLAQRPIWTNWTYPFKFFPPAQKFPSPRLTQTASWSRWVTAINALKTKCALSSRRACCESSLFNYHTYLFIYFIWFGWYLLWLAWREGMVFLDFFLRGGGEQGVGCPSSFHLSRPLIFHSL